METLYELLPVLLTALVGAAVPMAVAAYYAWRAKVVADGVKDWQDVVVSLVDSVAEELDEDEGPKA